MIELKCCGKRVLLNHKEPVGRFSSEMLEGDCPNCGRHYVIQVWEEQ